MFADTEAKYRPDTLDRFLFPNVQVEQLIRAYGKGEIKRPLLLWGKHGTGKSLLAELIPQAIDGKAVIVERVAAEDFRSKKDVLTKFSRNKQFDRLFSTGDQRFNYVVLEEMDFDSASSKAFREVFDQNAGSGITIITTNEIGKIDAGMLSRCEVLEVPPLLPALFSKRAKEIIVAEGFKIDDALLLEALEATYAMFADNRKYYAKLDELLRRAQSRV